MLCGVGWQFFTDVSGQPISPIVKYCLTCEYVKADRLSQNVGNQLPSCAA